MSKKAIFLMLFSVMVNNLSAEEILLDRIIVDEDLKTMQQAANLLMLFVTEKPDVADEIIQKDANPNISKAKTAALDAIQKKCCSLSKLQSEPSYKIKLYEKQLNEIYQKLHSKLKRPYQKILYGPRKGKELPKSIHFFFNKQNKHLSKAPDTNMLYDFFGKIWNAIQIAN